MHALLVPVGRIALASAPSGPGRGETLVLDQAVRDVDAEAVDASVEPEAQHRLEEGPHLG